MDNVARELHKPLTREDFICNHYSPTSDADMKIGMHLTNRIHSLFSFLLIEMPANKTSWQRWGKLTGYEYELLIPALRLATKLLESAPSCDAICSIVYGDRYPSGVTHKGLPVMEFCRHDNPPKLVRERAGRVLTRLGNTITFMVTDKDRGKVGDERAHGRTSGCTCNFPQGVDVSDLQRSNGLAAVVVLDPQYLKMLKKLREEVLGRQFQVVKLWFEIALTLCHEVMHAINLALSSDLFKLFAEKGEKVGIAPFNEPFFQGQPVAELGYFWETHLFGGTCIQSVPNPTWPIFLADWPSWMFRDKKQQAERALPKRKSFKWLVAVDFVKNIQTQEFWDRIDNDYPQDLLVLRIRKRVGVKCFMPMEYEDYSQTFDPEEWDNEPGAYMRVPCTEDDPSAGARLANETTEERSERIQIEESLIRDLQQL